MPRKSAAQKAAEEEAAAAAAAEEERRATERKRLLWAGALIAALAVFAGGYAIGQSNADEADIRPGPLVFGDELPPFVEDFDAEGFEFDFDFEPPRDGDFRFEPRVRLTCEVVEDEGDTMELICEFRPPQFFPDDERPDDEQRDERAGFLGVTVRNTPRGVVVVEVGDDSPAAEAGIEADDAILEFDGVEIESTDQLADLVADTPAGSEVTVLLGRNGSRVSVEVVLGERA